MDMDKFYDRGERHSREIFESGMAAADKGDVASEEKVGGVLTVSFKEFGDNTTFHGLRYVTNHTYHVCRRVAWVIVVLGAAAWLLVCIVRAFMLLFQYPSTSSVSFNYVPSIAFPAVTICNINQFRSDALNPAAVSVLAKVFGNSVTPPDPDTDVSALKEVFPSEDDSHLIDIIFGTAHQIERMLFDCRWKNERCSHRNFTARLTDHGVCYTFNEPADEGDVLQVQNSGSRHGLFMRLFIEQDLYTHGESTAAGMRVYLHPQGEFPVIKEFAFNLAPGFEASVAVQKTVVKSLQAPYNSNCTPGTLDDFPFKYSVAACKFESKARYVTEKCGCRDYRWPGTAKICPADKQISCVYRFEDEFMSQGAPCDCPLACETVRFDTKTSLAYWPAKHLSEDFRAILNMSDDFMRTNFLDVHIYFEEIMYVAVEQQMAFTVETLQCTIGGYMGLLCGMSLITVVEWADFFVLTIFKRLKL